MGAIRTFDALNEATDWVTIKNGQGFTTFVRDLASWSGTIALEYKRPGELDAKAESIETYANVAVFKTGGAQGNWLLRLKATAYTSGSCEGGIET